MPNLNKGLFIGEAIRSALEQTEGNLELLVVDDASTDDSPKIAESYAREDRRVTLLRHATTQGVSAARNTGIRSSRGKYIGFLDSDDTYAPTKLEGQVRVLNEARTRSVVYCDYWRIDQQGKELPPSRWSTYRESGMIFGDVLADRFGIKTAILLERKCFDEVGLFDESLPFAEDLDMILRLSAKFPFVFLDEKLYRYRIFAGNTRNRLPQSVLNSARASVIERYYKRERSTLTADQRKSVILNLTKHYSRSSQRAKMIRYGLSSYDSFKYLLSAPLHGHGIRHAVGSDSN
jgi:glycosyltransferase involved in cell wall biosynthesis